MKKMSCPTLTSLLAVAGSVVLLAPPHMSRGADQTNAARTALANAVAATTAPGQPRPELLFQVARQDTIVLSQNRTNTALAVQLRVAEYAYRLAYGGQTNWPLDLVEFGVCAQTPTPFAWFCWEYALTHPHDFRLFQTATNGTYAGYCSGDGVRLFRVTESLSSENAREFCLSRGVRPDALPLLSNERLGATAGGQFFWGVNALHWTIVVDEVNISHGQVQVTLHGEQPEPKFIFVLRDGKWELVPTPAKRAK